jgi:hypothetical protein
MSQMMKYLETYDWASSGRSFLYNSDLDEVPDAMYLKLAVAELQSGACDAVRGVWRDRSTMDGSLKRECAYS